MGGHGPLHNLYVCFPYWYLIRPNMGSHLREGGGYETRYALRTQIIRA